MIHIVNGPDSLLHFIKTFFINISTNDNNYYNIIEPISFMSNSNDKLIKIGQGISDGDEVHFEYEERGNISKKLYHNIEKYSVIRHDSFLLELKPII